MPAATGAGLLRRRMKGQLTSLKRIFAVAVPNLMLPMLNQSGVAFGFAGVGLLGKPNKETIVGGHAMWLADSNVCHF